MARPAVVECAVGRAAHLVHIKEDPTALMLDVLYNGLAIYLAILARRTPEVIAPMLENN